MDCAFQALQFSGTVEVRIEGQLKNDPIMSKFIQIPTDGGSGMEQVEQDRLEKDPRET